MSVFRRSYPSRTPSLLFGIFVQINFKNIAGYEVFTNNCENWEGKFRVHLKEALGEKGKMIEL